MVEDIVKYLKLEGESIRQIKNLLGPPDYVEWNKISYKIEEGFGSNIDPVEATILTLKFDKDSVITEKKIENK